MKSVGVFGTHPHLAWRRNADHQDDLGEIPTRQACDEEHPRSDADEDQRGAEVGLQQHERADDHQHQHRGTQDPVWTVDLPLARVEERGQRHDQGELGYLRGLHAELPELEPAAGAACASPDGQHDDKQGDAGGSQSQCETSPMAVIDAERDQEHATSDAD